MVGRWTSAAEPIFIFNNQLIIEYNAIMSRTCTCSKKGCSASGALETLRRDIWNLNSN